MTYPQKPSGNYTLRDYDFAQADSKKLPMDEYLFKNGYKNAEESDTESVPDAHEQNWLFDVLHRNLRYAVGTAEENKSRIDGLKGSTSSVIQNSDLNLTSGGAYTYLVRRASTTTGTGSANQPIYVKADGQITTCNTMVATTGNQTITGTKTFSSTISGSVDGSADVSKYLGNHNETASSTTPVAPTSGMAKTSGLFLTGTYNDGATPVAYGNIINMAGNGTGQLLCEWSGADNTTGSLYYRSHRDTNSGGWSPWKRLVFTDGNITGSSGSCTGNSATATTATTATKASTVNNTRNNGALKYWTGTSAQYNAIANKDANTLYNITDDQSDVTLTLLEAIYPVGSLYMTTNSSCPLSVLFGKWQLVSSGRALWTGNGTNGNTTIEAGLPNITGSASLYAGGTTATNGAITYTRTSWNNNAGGGDMLGWASFDFDASNSNSIYGNSTTVQPPAYVINVFRRTS